MKLIDLESSQDYLLDGKYRVNAGKADGGYVKRKDTIEKLKSDIDRLGSISKRIKGYLVLGIESIPSAGANEIEHETTKGKK